MTGKGKPYKSTRGKRTSSKFSSRTDEVLNLASEFLDACNPQAAQLIFEEALAANPDDAILLDALGELLYDLGEEEQAKARFLKSAEVSPGGSHAKWVHLGTMSEGAEAVGYFRRGINLLESRVMAASAAAKASFASSLDSVTLLKRSLSNSYCSIAEIYMSDLCDEPEAEREAETSAAAAVTADEQNPDAHAVYASVRLSQSRPSEAAIMLKRASALLEALCREMEEDVLKEDDGNNEEGDMVLSEENSSNNTTSLSLKTTEAKELLAAQSAALMPAYHSRLSLGKMCMESELWHEASDIFDRLLAEDDTVMEIWFLLGEAQLHSQDFNSALDTVTTAAAIVSSAISTVQGHSAIGGKKGSKGQKGMSKTKAGFGEGAAIRSATAEAIQNAPLDFSKEVIASLLSTPIEELQAQLLQFSKLIDSIKTQQQQQVENNASTMMT